MKFIDLTHTFTREMPVYPGDQAPVLKQAGGKDKFGFVHFELQTGMHVGTHMDAPLHMITGGKKLSDFPVEKFFGNGVLIDARDKDLIDADVLDGADINPGDIILVMTGFSEKFGQGEYYQAYPEVSKSFAARIIKLGAKMIGLDTPSPDRPPFAVHKLLLEREILIIENLTNLEALLPMKKFEVIALPAKFDADAAPVRVVAKIG